MKHNIIFETTIEIKSKYQLDESMEDTEDKGTIKSHRHFPIHNNKEIDPSEQLYIEITNYRYELLLEHCSKVKDNIGCIITPVENGIDEYNLSYIDEITEDFDNEELQDMHHHLFPISYRQIDKQTLLPDLSNDDFSLSSVYKRFFSFVELNNSANASELGLCTDISEYTLLVLEDFFSNNLVKNLSRVFTHFQYGGLSGFTCKPFTTKENTITYSRYFFFNRNTVILFMDNRDNKSQYYVLCHYNDVDIISEFLRLAICIDSEAIEIKDGEIINVLDFVKNSERIKEREQSKEDIKKTITEKMKDYRKEQIAKHGLEKVMNMERSVEMTDEETEEQTKYATDYLENYKNDVEELQKLEENRKKQQIALSLSEYVRLINNNSKLNYLLPKLTLRGITPDFTNAPRMTEEECIQQYDEIIQEKVTQIERFIEKKDECQTFITYRDGRKQPSRVFTIDVKQEEDTVEHIRESMATWSKPEKIITIPLEDYVSLKNKEQKLNIMEDTGLDEDIRCSVAMANFHEIVEEDYKDDPRTTTKQQRSR